MTAILGYTYHINEKDSIGILCADNLEGASKSTVDKVSKLNGRFAIATCGEQAVDNSIFGFVVYFDQYDGSKILINSISEFETFLNDFIPKTFKELKKSSLDANGRSGYTFLVILDTLDNNLYHIDLGEVWKIDEVKNYKVKVTHLKDGLHRFGFGTGNQILFENCIETKPDKIVSDMEARFMTYNEQYPYAIGFIGSTQINILGSNKHSKFTSAHKTWMQSVLSYVKQNPSI